MGQLTFKSGSSYSAFWEVRNTTLCAMENQVKELTSLINELYELGKKSQQPVQRKRTKPTIR